MDLLPIRDDLEVDLASGDDNLVARHRFEPEQLMAVNAALSAARPLLVRGEPGIGKSQLARAAAKALGRAFVQHVVDARTEPRDLQWHFDAVGRLAQAQLAAAVQTPVAGRSTGARAVARAGKALDQRLAISNFVQPRALWWAFDRDSARQQVRAAGGHEPYQPDGGDWQRGCVVLIDEIDKAESDVPNGLLEALGARRFSPPGVPKPVVASGSPPLVVITTNEERALPDAFIRRCLVLHLTLPQARDALVNKLMERGCTHFRDPASGVLQVAPEVLEQAAGLLADDREKAQHHHWRPLPGQAEYLDLVRAVVTQAGGDMARQHALIGQVATFVLKKHPDAARERAGADG